MPPGRPFLRALADAILAGDLPTPGGAKPTPISLSSYTLLLPTRRATRALQDAFLASSTSQTCCGPQSADRIASLGGGAAMLLPKIRPIAEGLEDLSLLAGSAGLAEFGPDSAEIPPAISELERRLALTELVLAWSASMRRAGGELGAVAAAGASTPAQAARLAEEAPRALEDLGYYCVDNLPATLLLEVVRLLGDLYSELGDRAR